MRIEVVKRDERFAPGLNTRRTVWVFWLTGVYLVLHEYRHEERPTPRHKWRATEVNVTRRLSPGMTLDDVPMPKDVQAEAMQRVFDSLKVVRHLR